MDWKDVGAKIANVAPVLGGAVGGPAGAVAGKAIKLIAGALGCEEKPAAVVSALQANPDALLKLKELETRHKEEIYRLTIQEQQIYLQDVANARAREAAYINKIGRPDYNLYFLAWVLVVGFFILIGMMFWKPVPNDASGVVFMLFGSLSSAFGSVVGYFFGSSAGSRQKDIVAQVKKP